MTERQAKLVEMMQYFHSFCEKHQITYYAIGGTALGAVRHKGFIPWDDDMDLGVPRTDYERLKDLANVLESESKFKIEFPLENKEYVFAYAKLYDTSTTLIESARKPIKRGIYIDLFPLDGLGNDEQEALKNFKKVDKKLNLLYARTRSFDKGYSWYKNLAIFFARCMPKFILGKDKLIKDIEKLSKKYNYEQSAYVGNLVGAWHEKEMVQKAWLGQPLLVPFETGHIFIPENADACLTHVYGDYMKLPPIEKQVSHHDYIYENLYESYTQK